MTSRTSLFSIELGIPIAVPLSIMRESSFFFLLSDSRKCLVGQKHCETGVTIVILILLYSLLASYSRFYYISTQSAASSAFVVRGADCLQSGFFFIAFEASLTEPIEGK